MTKWNPKHPQMPTDKDGNWQHFPMSTFERVGDQYVRHPNHWVIVQEPFYAVLEIDRMNTGRSAKYATVRNVETGVTYPMFVSDLLDVIRYAEVSEGQMRGTWTGSKRGQNYGIKIVKE